jgi:flagellar protein FliL
MAEQAKGEKKPLNIKLIMNVFLVIANLGVGGLGLFWTYSATLGWIPPKITEEQLQAIRKEEVKIDDPLIFTMDKFTVNLEGEPKRMVRIEVNLEMLNKDGFEEVFESTNRARVRDKVVRLLGSKNFDDIETIQGKLFLKDRIASEVNSILNEGTVKEVFFTEFVVQ